MPKPPELPPDTEPLLTPVESDHLVVNGRCIIYEVEGIRVVMVDGVPVFRYHRDDSAAEDLFAAQAQVSGYATSKELGAALGRSDRTLRHKKKLFEEGGAKNLLPKERRSTGQRLSGAEDAAIRKWHKQGLSGRQIAVRLKKAPLTVQRALRRLGLRPHSSGRAGQQQSLLPSTEPPPEPDPATEPPGEAESAEDAADEPPGDAVVEAMVDPVPAEDDGQPATSAPDRLQDPYVEGLVAVNGDGTLDRDPADRSIDRMLAQRGELYDAAPFFAPGEDIPRLGVLLALPMLVASGLFEEADELYGHLGPAFYGLRTSLLTLVLLALLRVKHPENLKEYSPPELGRLLGLDRAPEVKTLRRKLARLAGETGEKLLRRLVERRVESRSEALGFLYVDGHVRVYSGEHKLPKTHVARMRISLPATQDVWVNDADGDPLFFVTQEAHPSLVGALASLLDDIRELVGDRRVTFVFDRGGWSPRLFKAMFDAGFDVLTYRKGSCEPVPDDGFSLYAAPGSGGQQHWELHDMDVTVSNGLVMRQVTRRKGSHQTHVLTTNRLLSTVEVAHRMFDRWRQENFFKYMRQEFAIDALVQYGAEPDDPQRDMPNPAWAQADKALAKARAKLRRLEAQYGAAARENPEKKRPTIRGFKIAHGTEIGIPMREVKAEVDELRAVRDALPKRVTVGELDDPPVRLLPARKRLSDGLKMLAYQVETDLYRLLAPHYARADDEGRTLLASALQSAGDLECSHGELRVTLAPQSSPHRSRAVAELCETLNETRTCFPGTVLVLRYSVRGVDGR